ncbi:MAG: hypothetical protein U0790_24000 [Isosphaeraceae bacterium]
MSAPDASSEGPPATRRNEAPGTPAGASGGGGFGAFGGGGLEAPDPNEARITIARISAQIAATDKNPRNVAILKKLEEPVSLRFPNETPLEDVLKLIKKSGVKGEDGRSIPIYVDPTGLAEAEKTMTSPVVIDLDDVPLKFSLRLVLKQLGLAYCIRDGVLIISSVEGIQQELKEAQAEQMGMHPEQYPMGMGGMGGGTMGGMGGGMR